MRRESGKGGEIETFGQTGSPLAWASGLAGSWGIPVRGSAFGARFRCLIWVTLRPPMTAAGARQDGERDGFWIRH
jgi:hypothetical protein